MTLPRMTTIETGGHQRPIVVHDNTIDGTHWRTVHGIYGHALLCGRTDVPVDVTLTWTSTLPATTRVALVTPGTPTPTLLYLPRELLLHGGNAGASKVDLAGLLACITISGSERQLWLTLNRHWLREFLENAGDPNTDTNRRTA